MDKIFYLIIFSLLLGACSKEDSLEPTGERDDYFSVPENATDPESVIRRKFYEDHGVHVLFNDTLRHEQRGTYADGTPYWYTETIDLGYSLRSDDGKDFQFEYINTQTTKEEAIKFVEDYILPHLGKSVRPYSFLLVDNLSDWYGKKWRTIDYYEGERCLALNMKPVLDTEDEQAYSDYCTIIFQSIVTNKMGKLDKAIFDEFNAFSDEYYWYDYVDFYEDFYDYYDDFYDNYKDDYDDAKDAYEAGEINEEEYLQNEAVQAYNEYYAYCKQIANECGFISVSTRGWFPSYASDDRDTYVKAIFNTPEEEFMEEYKDYPIVRTKYSLIKKIISDMGFVF